MGGDDSVKRKKKKRVFRDPDVGKFETTRCVCADFPYDDAFSMFWFV